MAILNTSDLELPDEILTPWLGKVKGGSTIATLSDSEPLKFGKGQAMIFDIGEAEYVGEGGNKGSTTFQKSVQNTNPFKFHKTVRWTDEVVYADEDHQLDVVNQILNQIQPALSRALDFGVFHGINPTGGATVAAMTQRLSQTTNVVEYDPAAKPYLALDAADQLVLAGSYIPSDFALDPALASPFSTARSTQGEQKLYPNFRLTTDRSDLEAHNASVSRTVGAKGVAATDTGVLGFVGDFGAIRWGIQRAIGLELIKYGDPDGQGDLKRNNQVAFRAEVIYGWGIADLAAFAQIVEAERE